MTMDKSKGSNPPPRGVESPLSHPLPSHAWLYYSTDPADKDNTNSYGTSYLTGPFENNSLTSITVCCTFYLID